MTNPDSGGGQQWTEWTRWSTRAAVVAALNREDAERTVMTNVTGARTVLDAAIAAGCDPIVHISSVAALFIPWAPPHHRRAPTRDARHRTPTPGRRRWPRSWPATGRTPARRSRSSIRAGSAGLLRVSLSGEVAEGFISMLKSGVAPAEGRRLRDHRRSRPRRHPDRGEMSPGHGPRRFVAGGTLLDMTEVGRLLRVVTGRRIPVVPLPGAALPRRRPARRRTARRGAVRHRLHRRGRTGAAHPRAAHR